MRLSSGGSSSRQAIGTRMSSIYVGEPYKSQEQIQREAEKKENVKNIGPDKFNLSIPKSRVHDKLTSLFVFSDFPLHRTHHTSRIDPNEKKKEESER